MEYINIPLYVIRSNEYIGADPTHRKVSPSQLLILMEIRDHPGRMSREIATRCHLDPSNVSHRLDYLVQAGDVIRTGTRPCVFYISRQGRDFLESLEYSKPTG